MRAWSLGLAAILLLAAPAAAQDSIARENVIDPETGPEAPLVGGPGLAGQTFVPATCKGGVAREEARPSASYGPAVPDSIRTDDKADPCKAPEFQPRAETELLYESQRVFENASDERAGTAMPNPCVWRQDSTSCSVRVGGGGSPREQNRTDGGLAPGWPD